MQHMQLKNPEFLYMCEEWQTVVRDVATLSEELKGSAYAGGTLQVISDECDVVLRLGAKLRVSASMKGGRGG